MNLSNPKGKSFDAEGIGCGGNGRSKAICLKEKLAGGFSQSIILVFFNCSNHIQVLARSFCR